MQGTDQQTTVHCAANRPQKASAAKDAFRCSVVRAAERTDQKTMALRTSRKKVHGTADGQASAATRKDRTHQRRCGWAIVRSVSDNRKTTVHGTVDNQKSVQGAADREASAAPRKTKFTSKIAPAALRTDRRKASASLWTTRRQRSQHCGPSGKRPRRRRRGGDCSATNRLTSETAAMQTDHRPASATLRTDQKTTVYSTADHEMCSRRSRQEGGRSHMERPTLTSGERISAIASAT
jgi:hypothetical protein